jgi:pimeloyl-ACP methyl ester carboxylesterase
MNNNVVDPNPQPSLSAPVDIAFISTADGTEQRYVLMLPVNFNPKEKHHLMIALHGHGSDRWQYAQAVIDECRSARAYAAKYNMIYISPDYRATTSWMGPLAEADMVQIIKEMRKQYRIGKVILNGASMGGSSVLSFAALHPKLIDGVISHNGTANHLEYENFQDAIAASFGGTKAQIPEEYKHRSAEYWPERLTMPIAMAVGGLDDSVPPHSVLRLAAILKKMNRPVLLIYREQGGHNTTYEDCCTTLDFVFQHCGID